MTVVPMEARIMRIPFRRELDDVFQSDRSIWLKMGGSSIVATFAAVTSILRSNRNPHLHTDSLAPLLIVAAGISAVAGALAALALSLKDVVQRRVARGEPVNSVLRLYFGMGAWSLVAWFPTVIIVTFFILIATLS
jgi:hypothetical protein